VLGEASSDLVGLLNLAQDHVEIEGLPANLPSNLHVDVSALTAVGQHVTAGELALPEGITLITDLETVLVTVSALTVVQDEWAEEAAEAPAEAADAPAEEAAPEE